MIIILIIIIFYLIYRNMDSELRGYKRGCDDLSKSLLDDLDQAIKQLERDKKIKYEKLKTNITNTSNSADESADSSGL